MTDRKSVEKLPVGLKKSVEVAITREMVDAFVTLSGDDNPIHVDPSFAQAAGLRGPVVHGCLTLAVVSRLIGTTLPGPGALMRSLQVDWLKPVFAGDRLIVSGEVEQHSASTESVLLRIEGRNQVGTVVMRVRAAVGLLSRTGADPTAGGGSGEASAAKPAEKSPNQAASATDRAVMVTGESMGIGRAIALELGRCGYPVAVGYLEAEREANESVREIVGAGGKAAAICLDLSSRDQIIDALAKSAAGLGPVLAVVHAATPPADSVPVAELQEATLDWYWRVCAKGALALCQGILPAVRSSGWGRFIFLGSGALIGAPPARMAAYVTAKSAALGLMRSLAVELGPFGMTVNAVSPGLTPADIGSNFSPRVQMVEAQRNPLRRLAQASDIAQMVRFLMSDEAAFINGAHLPITGGAPMM